MKEKYIDEQFGYWCTAPSTIPGKLFILGSDTASRVEWLGPYPEIEATLLVAEHNRVQRKLVDTIQEFERVDAEAFKKYWWEGCVTL